MTTLLLRNIRRLYTCDSGDAVVDGAWLLCNGTKIEAFGVEPCPVDSSTVAVERDLTGCAVMPGLINLHHHFFESVTRAVPATLGAFGRDWIARLYPLWIALTPEDMGVAARVAASELALTGVTTSVDHAFLTRPQHDVFVAAEVDAVRAVGVRLHLVHGGITGFGEGVAERLKPVLGEAASDLLDTPDTLVKRLEHLAAKHHDAGPGSKIALAIGPLGVAYGSGDFMRRMADLARDLGAHLHTHCHPRPSERDESQTHWGMDSLDFLRSAGWLREGTALVHCTELRDDEVRMMADCGTAMVHCPRTVIRLGYPVPPVGAWAAMGLRIGFGVDGAASNDGGGLLPDLRLGLLLHRVAQRDAQGARSWLSCRQVLHAVTCHAAAVLGRSDIGVIAKGKQADLAAFDVMGVPYSGSIAEPIDRLLFSGIDGHTELTVCGGQIIAERGGVDAVDLKALAAEADRVAARLTTATH